METILTILQKLWWEYCLWNDF